MTGDSRRADARLPAAVHFVGIGGAGMSGIARILLARGHRVSGSDARDSVTLAALRALGARVHVGHAAAQVGDAAAVVVSSAIRPDNPETAEARRRRLPVLPRAAALAALMTGRRSIAVAGTHGKTTTTSMLTVAVQHCGVDPSYAIGGDLNEAGSNAHHGAGQLFIAEADESDGSFLLLRPHGVVVTNVEADHLDHYPDAEAVQCAFSEFLRAVPPGGFAVLCLDDPGSARLLPQASAQGLQVCSYGSSVDADLRIRDLQLTGTGSRFQVLLRGRRLGPVRLIVPGRHNALNAAGALAAGLLVGLPFVELVTALAGFPGARRRFETKGEAAGVRVVDSYDHHPTELRALLGTARTVQAGRGRVVAVFQPHRYTRTAAFAAELGAALGLADLVVVMEVYSAGEAAIPGVTGAAVAGAVPLPAGRVVFEPSWSAVPDLLASLVRPGDMVLTVGAGDVTMLGPELLDRLRQAG